MTTGPDAALALAKRIQDFWLARGVRVSLEVRQHYQDWVISSSLTGQEACERITVRPVVEKHT